MILTLSENLAPVVDDVLRHVLARLRTILPSAEFHHVGSTAIPGALTKGDLDVLIRVEREEFPQAVEALRQHFAVKQPQNWDPYFASFGDDSRYSMPLGVQVVIKDSEADFFLFIHEYLVSHPKVLADYNRMKLEYADKGAAEYWAAKDRILAPIVSLKVNAANKAPEPTPGAVTPRATEGAPK